MCIATYIILKIILLSIIRISYKGKPHLNMLRCRVYKYGCAKISIN